MARTFAYLMQPGARLADEDIFPDISRTIEQALRRTRDHNPQLTGLWQASLAWSLEDVMQREESA